MISITFKVPIVVLNGRVWIYCQLLMFDTAQHLWEIHENA